MGTDRLHHLNFHQLSLSHREYWVHYKWYLKDIKFIIYLHFLCQVWKSVYRLCLRKDWYTCTYTPLFVNVIIFSCGAPKFFVICNCALIIHIAFVTKWKGAESTSCISSNSICHTGCSWLNSSCNSCGWVTRCSYKTIILWEINVITWFTDDTNLVFCILQSTCTVSPCLVFIKIEWSRAPQSSFVIYPCTLVVQDVFVHEWKLTCSSIGIATWCECLTRSTWSVAYSAWNLEIDIFILMVPMTLQVTR